MDSFTKPSPTVPDLNNDDSDDDKFTGFQASTVATDNDVHNTQSTDGHVPSMDSFIDKSMSMASNANTGGVDFGLPAMDSFTTTLSLIPKKKTDDEVDEKFGDAQSSTEVTKSDTTNIQTLPEGELPSMDSFTKSSSMMPDVKKDESVDEFSGFQASNVVTDKVIGNVPNAQSPDGDLPSMDSFIGKSTPPMPTSNTGESEIGFGDFQASSAATGNVPSSQDVLPSMDSFTPSMSMMPNENNEASDTNLGKGFSEFQGSSMLMKSGENAENTQLTDDGLPAIDSFTKAMPMVSNGNVNDSDKNFRDFQTPTTVPSDIGTTNIQSTL